MTEEPRYWPGHLGEPDDPDDMWKREPGKPYLALTQEERNAIATLKRLAKRWPRMLWLFSASSALWVMKRKDDGTTAMGGRNPSPEGADSDYRVTLIDIPNDGGDW